jgi:glycosidase
VEYTPTPAPEIDTPAWFDEAILYEIFLRSFYDSDGDGIGDLAGIAANLDHLEDLGATAVWLMPIHPSPSYHGYDVTDYFDINPDYGTLDDMYALIDAARERDIHIIMDLVVNHMSKEHPIFQDAYANPDSEYADWFLWTDDYHTAYEAFGGYKHMPKLNHENPEVLAYVPKLNHENPEVLAYVLEIARFWMDPDGDGDPSDGVDGFRADVAKEVPLETWQALRDEMRALNPGSFLLGEVWEGNAQKLIPWYAEAFDALFDFPLYHALASDHDVSGDGVLAGAQEPDFLNAVIVGEDRLFPPGYQVVRFTNNHDTNRVMSDVLDDPARAKTAATLLLTLPGTPMIYYGEAFGMRGEKGKGAPYWDEYRREPMDWYSTEEGEGMTTWFKPGDRYNAPYDGISVEEQDGVAASLLDHYRALGELRHAHPALRSGAFGKVTVDEAEGVYAYTRHAPPSDSAPEEWFLIILNFSDEAQQPALGLSLAFQGPFAAVDALTGETWPEVPAGEAYRIELAPRSGSVLQLSPEGSQ